MSWSLFAGSLSRAHYWLAVVIIIGARVAGFQLFDQKFINLEVYKAIDYATMIVLAGVLAKRFRDFRWPGWIGIAALLLTAFLPTAIFLYLNAGHLPRSRMEFVENWVGTASSASLVILLLLAGLPRTLRLADPRPPALHERIEPKF